MKKQFNPWEEKLGERLQNLQGTPAFDAWDRIEAELEDKPRWPWLWIAAAIALLLAPAGFWMWHTNGDLTAGSPTLAGNTTIAREHETAAASENPSIESDESASSGSVAGLGHKLSTEEQGPTSPASPASSATLAKVGENPATANGAQQQEVSVAKSSKKAANAESGSNMPATAEENSTSTTSEYALQTAPGATIDADGTAVAQHQDNHVTTETAEAEPSVAAAEFKQGKPAESAVRTDVAALNGTKAFRDNKLLSETEQLTEAAIKSETTVPPVNLTEEEKQHTLIAIVPGEAPLRYNIEAPEVQVAKAVPPVFKKEKREKQRSMATMWVKAQPTLSYSQVEPSKTDGIIITSLASEPAVSGSRMGGQLAAGVSYPLLKSLNWKSGAYYWYQQQRLSYTYHNARPDAYQRLYADANALSYSPTHFEQSQTIEKSYHNVGLSTGLSYKLPTRFVNSFLDIEAMLHYNAEQRINTFLSLGYSVKAKLDGKTSLSVGPAVQFQLNNNESISPHFDEKPLIFGLQFGLLLNDK
ncbi:hypothetical protein [Cesiribacter sp. SM1]|uniref:hypothetical protein n=1 Tax=Cesiribacter sp. SM1 TaxID=2861196 RepID=UPI001CD25262|nr:hypothetical protein [Cesiribacter sp. SM1]